MTKQEWIDENLGAICDAYLEAAAWSTTDYKTERPLDDFNLPFSRSAEEKAEKDCLEFLEQLSLEDLLKTSEEPIVDRWSIRKMGHDFWLTRKEHGAGFWDGDWSDELGDKLTKLAESFPEKDLIRSGNNRYLVFI
jgi:hypothetical protein